MQEIVEQEMVVCETGANMTMIVEANVAMDEIVMQK